MFAYVLVQQKANRFEIVYRKVTSSRPVYYLILYHLKPVNLKYITVGRLDDDMIVPPSDGAMFILID